MIEHRPAPGEHPPRIAASGSALPVAFAGTARHGEKLSALPSVSASSKIRSALPSESRGGTRPAEVTEAAGVPAPFPSYLGWTHSLILMRVANPTARALYEIEAARESWSSRELERQSRRSSSNAWRRAATRRRFSRSHGVDTKRAEHEAETIGIVLCSERNDAMAKITLPENNEQILAARYQKYLPTEEELRAELAREREAVERALRLAASVEVPGND